MLSRVLAAGSVIGLIFAAGQCASGQVVTATILHPGSFTGSAGNGAGGTQQGGNIDGGGGVTNAVIWNRTAASVVSLHPLGAVHSNVFDTDGTQQVGTVYQGSIGRAALWTGTAASFVDLTPEPVVTGAYRGASALGVGGGQQVGWAYLAPFPGSSQQRACVWSGSAGSVVDLHPVDTATEVYYFSLAYGTNGTKQVGFVRNLDGFQASVWSGTLESWVNLNPEGAIRSVAYAISDDGTQQVGDANFTDSEGLVTGFRAGLWNGTASSWVSLHPTGASQSSAQDTTGAIQVGSVTIGFDRVAAFWRGSASSWVNLNEFLPGNLSDWEHGGAESVSTVGPVTYIAGTVRNKVRGRYESILWTVTLPTCPADFNGSGLVEVIDIFAFLDAWFANDPRADFDGVGGVAVQDIFAFLGSWFSGCD